MGLLEGVLGARAACSNRLWAGGTVLKVMEKGTWLATPSQAFEDQAVGLSNESGVAWTCF